MKKTVFVILSMFFSALPPIAHGQKTLYIGYVCQDESVSVDRMIRNIQNFVKQHKNDDFVLLYNDNTSTIVMDNKNYNESKLFGMIRTRNSTIYISADNELEALSNAYDKYLKSKHTATSINFFVGKDFFADRYNSSLVARFLIINGIMNNDRNTLTYYPCGDGITQDNIAFDKKYDISITPIIK